MGNKKINKTIKKDLIIILIIIIAICLTKGLFLLAFLQEKTQKMNNLDYNITINNDGSMTIVETWDIFISKTNTIFKNFNKSSKFGEINNVSVKDLETGKELTQIYQEMYHVTTDCFYALDIKNDKFEIAWGTGLENSHGNKKYQITYTVTDVISEYNDCQELYWMLLSSTNSIPVRKTTGTITLPKNVSSIDNLYVWGHGPLNGKIEKISANKVQFDLDNLYSGRMLEIRVVTSDKISEVNSLNKKQYYNNLSNIIKEETNWAEQANESTQNFNRFIRVVMIIYSLIILIQLIKIFKNYKELKKEEKKLISINSEYFRDIPRDGNSTPMEAEYLYHFSKSLDNGSGYQADAVAANILNLTLKKYISLKYEGEQVYIQILKDDAGLKNDEKAVYSLLKKVGKEEKFEISELNKYAKKHFYNYSELINKMVNSARENLYNENLVNKAEKRKYEKAKRAEDTYSMTYWTIIGTVLWTIISYIPFFRIAEVIPMNAILTIAKIIVPFATTVLINSYLLNKLQPKIAVLTQEGYTEMEQWKGLSKFLKDYSMLDEATVPSLEIWEKYLVFATAFGFADKVIEQMKAKYPEVFVKEYWKDEKSNQYPVLNFTIGSSLQYNVVNTNYISHLISTAKTAYKTSLSEIARHASSSGGGGGGGFSGGGGGRWRPVDGMGGR